MATKKQTKPKAPPKQKQKPEQQPSPRRGQFAGLSLDDLQELYIKEIGRPSGSTDRKYLEWKIRYARTGNVRIGPRSPRAGIPDPKLIPIRLEIEEIEALDAAIKAAGVTNRMAFFRKAFVAGLKSMQRSADDDAVRATITRAITAFDR